MKKELKKQWRTIEEKSSKVMKINHILDKGSHQLNEDNFVIKDNIFGVFDGAGSLDKYKDESGKTGGFLASSITKKIFSKNDKSLQDLAVEANNEIHKEMLTRNIDVARKINLWSASAAVIKIKKDTFDWLQIGDSLIMTIGEDGAFNVLVNNYDHDKELLALWKKLAEKRTRHIHDQIRDKIIKVREQMNVSYGILNGENEMVKFLNCGTKELDDIKHILIFTDGLFIPKRDPTQEDDFETFTKLFLEGGLLKIQNYIRAIEKNDPDCWEFPRFHQCDDIAAISISF